MISEETSITFCFTQFLQPKADDLQQDPPIPRLPLKIVPEAGSGRQTLGLSQGLFGGFFYAEMQ